MKNLWFIGLFILSIAFLSCSDKDKNENELGTTKEGLVEKTDAKSPAQTEKQKKQIEVAKADAAFEAKVQKGDVVLLTINGEPEAFKFDGGSKITAMKLPDGNLYQVKEDGDRTMINVPGKGEMGIIMLNDKFYLFDDDNQAYEVKFSNKQLFAEKTELTDVLLSRK
jgi:hypothetical protein